MMILCNQIESSYSGVCVEVWRHFLKHVHFAVKIKMTLGISPPRMFDTDASVWNAILGGWPQSKLVCTPEPWHMK